MKTPQRIIDANANRVREALRVLEEAARFIAEDQTLARRLKQMRHDFIQALPKPAELIAHRDTPGDVGTQVSTNTEQSRASMQDVIAAANARLSEALRAIEEYSKLKGLDQGFSQLAQAAERLRYQGYDAAQQLTLAMAGGHAKQWRLCLLLTESLCANHDWPYVLQQAVANGADCIQVREKSMDAGPLLKRVREVLRLVAGRADVVVNDRPDIALLAGADGVHLGQTDLSPREVRKIVGPAMLIGVSTSSLDQAKAAKAQGADYCGVGPMFPTTTKHKPDLAGPDYLRDYIAWGGLPHLAIGGISTENISELIRAGVQGVAISSAICSASNPAQASAAISHAFADTAPLPHETEM